MSDKAKKIIRMKNFTELMAKCKDAKERAVLVKDYFASNLSITHQLINTL